MRISFIVFMSVLMLTTLSYAQEFGRASKGRLLAETWCVSCHLIDRKQTGTVQDGVPAFPAIAERIRKPRERERIQNWLHAPHGAMESINLSRQNIADLVAYIASLSPENDN